MTPDGVKFDGLAGLRGIMEGRREDFVSTATEKLLVYALGRGVEYYDQPAIRKIVREAAPGDYRWSSIILGITKSVPFQMKVRRELVIISKMAIPRRTVLRGLGSALALPLLDSMVPALSALARTDAAPACGDSA